LAITEQCIALAKENNSNLFLSDTSQAILAVSITALFDLPELHRNGGLQRPVRIAVLSPTSKSGKELVDFYETVCMNRGWGGKVFRERQEALDWLLK
jgi:hypothetical protein